MYEKVIDDIWKYVRRLFLWFVKDVIYRKHAKWVIPKLDVEKESIVMWFFTSFLFFIFQNLAYYKQYEYLTIPKNVYENIG